MNVLQPIGFSCEMLSLPPGNTTVPGFRILSNCSGKQTKIKALINGRSGQLILGDFMNFEIQAVRGRIFHGVGPGIRGVEPPSLRYAKPAHLGLGMLGMFKYISGRIKRARWLKSIVCLHCCAHFNLKIFFCSEMECSCDVELGR